MHTLTFLDPGHFHAALTLREGNPLVRDEIHVYAPVGEELDTFLRLIEAFNTRAARPTTWRPIVHAGERSLECLLDERPGDMVVLAGKNDRKMTLARRLHDAGLHVLADKPWLVSPEALADIRRVLSGGAVTMEIMTGRHELTSILAERLVRERDVFGEFETGDAEPAIRSASLHHLEKVVNGAPLRRPAWYFDVRIQGDGLADTPTHLVAEAQRLLRTHGRETDRDAELIGARRWATTVPRPLFARVTGADDFPADLRDAVDGDTLAYFANGTLSFRLRGVAVEVSARWDLTEPPGGGDAHNATVRGTRAQLRVEQGPQTNFRRRLFVEPRQGVPDVSAALARVIATWQDTFPGLAAVPAPHGFEIAIPAELRAGHENHFPLVLNEFIQTVDGGKWPDGRAADTLAKYELLARAAARVRDGATV